MRKRWGRNAVITMIASSLMLAGCSSDGGSKKEAAPEGTENVVHTTGFPIVDQTVDLKMFTRIAPVNGPFKEMPVFQDYEKLSNVKVEFIEAPTDGFQEKKTCCSPPMSCLMPCSAPVCRRLRPFVTDRQDS